MSHPGPVKTDGAVSTPFMVIHPSAAACVSKMGFPRGEEEWLGVFRGEGYFQTVPSAGSLDPCSERLPGCQIRMPHNRPVCSLHLAAPNIYTCADRKTRTFDFSSSKCLSCPLNANGFQSFWNETHNEKYIL